MIGLLVRVGINTASMKQRKAVVIAFPGRSAPTQQASAARVRKVPFRKPAHCCLDRDFALLPQRRIAIYQRWHHQHPNWNLEIQKTMFVELSEMRVRGS